MKIEKVLYRINWAKFKRNTSFFIPCIDEKAAKEQVARVARRLNLNVVHRVVIDDGVKGLRVWRV
jgi:cob(I)alamin adenosyltransferase